MRFCKCRIKGGGAILLVFLLFPFQLIADQYADAIYAKIPDICHPTRDDYKIIQDYLSFGHRSLIGDLKPWQYLGKAVHFKLLPRSNKEKIEHGIIPVNCTLEDKKNCVVLYSSFNHLYPKSLKHIIEVICNSSFKGHILYRIGGWPDLLGEGLKFAHLPFAFKVCAFREAKNLGYQNVLWLDASVIPLQNLNEIFAVIEEQGYFTFLTQFNMAELCNKRVCNIMKIDYPDQATTIPACLPGILGFNFKDAKAKEAFDRWYAITKDREECYFSHYQDLPIISIILYQMGMEKTPYWEGKVTWDKKEIGNSGLQFFIDKWGVQPHWPHCPHMMGFSIHTNKIVEEIPNKNQDFAYFIPGDSSTYIFDNEKDYYEDCQRSYFAITKCQDGWDSLRHYEILANGCIPYFIDLDECDEQGLPFFPKDLILEAMQLKGVSLGYIDHSLFNKERYFAILNQLIDYTRSNLTTKAMASYLLREMGYSGNGNILFLSKNTTPGGISDALLIGLKELLGDKVIDYPKVSHIYKSYPDDIKNLPGKGFSYTKLIDDIFMRRQPSIIKNNMLKKKYELIIYGCVYQEMPWHNLVLARYNQNKIAYICSEGFHKCEHMHLLHVFLREFHMTR